MKDPEKLTVLLTGGAGFIGSCVAQALADAGSTPVILDDLSIGRAESVSGMPLYVADIADGDAIASVFRDHPIDAVIHCAAVKSVPESVEQPVRYYRENVAKTVQLLGHLLNHNCRALLFSSSASVYADPAGDGITEDARLGASSPYARTKLMVENILADVVATGILPAVSLRYFNPIGADPKLRTGPAKGFGGTALGSLLEARRTGQAFRLMGTDWPTPDGTAVRDYVHVRDVAEAHVAALRWLIGANNSRIPLALNIGSGRGTSLRELKAAFDEATGGHVPVIEAPRRPGDVAGGYARVDRAADLIGWRPRFTLLDGIRDSLAWNESRIWSAQSAS